MSVKDALSQKTEIEGLSWLFKPLLTEKDGALKCHFCGKLVHVPGLKAHMDCAINAYVESLEKQA